MTKKVLVPIADGTEEVEAVSLIDVLRRAGAEVTVASVDAQQISSSRDVRIVADCLLKDCADGIFDLIALPGGLPGAEHLRDSKELTRLLKEQKESSRLYGAICASPAVVLKHHGLLGTKQATAHPYFSDELDNRERIDMPVVVDGNCVTSRGVGTALLFALKLVELLYGKEKAGEIAGQLVMKDY